MKRVINKRKLLGGIFGGLLFFACVIGVTFAYYNWRSTQESDVAVGFTIEDFCINYQDGGVITGELNESNNYTTTGTFTFNKTCDDLLYGHVYLSVNEFSATSLVREKALKWAIYEGESIDNSKLINTGNFNGESVSTSDNKIPLDINIEMSKIETKYTVAIYLDLDDLDTTDINLKNIKTEISAEASRGSDSDENEGLYDSLYVNSIGNSGYKITATAKDFRYNITNYQVTSGTESSGSISCNSASDSDWKSLTASNEQSINDEVSEDGVYCVWVKNSEGDVASKGIVIDTSVTDNGDISNVVIALGDMDRTKFNGDSRISIPLIVNSTKDITDSLDANEIDVYVADNIVSNVNKTLEVSDKNNKFYTLILEDLILADDANRGSLKISIGSGKVVNEDNESNDATTLTVGTYDDVKPVCTFGTIPNDVSKGVDFTVDIECTDSVSGMVWSGLTIDRLTTKDNDLKIVSVSTPTAITNGYKYTVTLNTNTLKADGYNLTLKADTVWDNSGNYNDEITSNVITTKTAESYTVTFTKGSNVNSIGATSLSCTPTGSSNTCEITAPSITPNDGYSILGWSLEGNTKIYITPGSKITVGSNVEYVSNVKDSEKPICTFGTISDVQYGNTVDVYVSCTDNVVVNETTLSVSNFTVDDTSIATVTSVGSPEAITNGYKYKVTVEGVNVGTYTLSINSGSVSDGENNLNDSASATGEVTVRPITYTADSASKVYDGTALTKQTATLTSGSLVNGDSATFSITGTITDVGSVTNTLNSVTIKKGDTDVSSNYNITKVNGTLTVTKKGIEKPTDSYCSNPTYNGSSQTITKTAGTGYTFSGNTGTNAGSYTVTATLGSNYQWSDGTTANVTFSCSISKKSVTYTADSASKVYDETALTKQTATLTSGSLVSGHTATFSITGTITDVGSVTNTLNSVTIMNGTTDVSSNYEITKVNGTLTVTKASVTKPTTSYCSSPTYNGSSQTITKTAGTGYTFSGNTGTTAGSYTVTATLGSNYQWSDGTTANVTFSCSISKKSVTYTADSASKVYDGTALTKQSATLTSGSLVSGHTATFLISGSITNVGSVTNTLNSVTIMSGTTNVSSNYDITMVNGTLEITKKSITITAKDQEISKDDSITVAVDQATVGGSGLVSGHSLSSIVLTANTTNMTITPSSATIEDSNGNDVTSNYSITYANGTLSYKALTYTIEYHLGNGSSTAGSTKLGSTTCEVGTACTLTAWSTFGATIPNALYGWSFLGWSSVGGTFATSVTYADMASVTNLSTTNGATVKIYAILQRTVTFYSGIAKATSNTATQYWNPYSTGTSYYTSNTVPTAASLTTYGWTYNGVSTGTSYSSTVTTTTTVKTAVNVNPVWYAMYSRTVTVNYNASGGTGTMSASTATQKYNSYGSVTPTSITLSSNSFTKSGWTFSCWAVSNSDTATCNNARASYAFNPAVNASASTTVYAKWQATGTFYYYSSGVKSTTATCATVGSSCSATIPSAVTGSTGQYSNAYGGLATSASTMSVAYASSKTTVTLSRAATHYSVYRSQLTLRYPSSDTACTSSTSAIYRNSYFTSTTAMSTVISNSTTGTTNTTTFTGIPSGATLKGFTTTVNSATTTSISTLAASTSTTIYAILNKTLTLTFYYNSYSSSKNLSIKTTTQNYTRDNYCTSTSKAKISDATLGSIPTEVSESKGPYNNSFSGKLATSTGTMSGSATLTTTNTTYYATYSEAVTRRYYNSSTTGWATETIYRNSWLTSTTKMSTVLASSATSTTALSYSSEKGPGGAAFAGLAAGTDEDTAGTVQYTSANTAAAYTTVTAFVTIYKVYAVGSSCSATTYANTLEHSENIASSGNTICPLVSNTDASYPSIDGNKTLTLNLNGKVITKTTNKINNTAGSTLTITGSSSSGQIYTEMSSIVIDNSGTLNLGTSTSSAFKITNDVSTATGNYTLYNRASATMNIKGITDLAVYDRGIANFGTLTISGGTLNLNDSTGTGMCVLSLYDGSTTTISAGTITGKSNNVICTGLGTSTTESGTLKVTGGTITAESTATTVVGLGEKFSFEMTAGTLKNNASGKPVVSMTGTSPSFTMSGGTITGGGVNSSATTGTISVTGGTITTGTACGLCSSGGGTITLNGGTVKGSGDVADNASSAALVSVSSRANVTITGSSRIVSFGQVGVYMGSSYTGTVTISATPIGSSLAASNSNITTNAGVTNPLIKNASSSGTLKITSGMIYAYEKTIYSVGTLNITGGTIATTTSSDTVGTDYVIYLSGSGNATISGSSYISPLVWNRGTSSAVYVASGYKGTLTVSNGTFYSSGSSTTTGTLGTAGNGLSIYGGTVKLNSKGFFESKKGRGIQISGSGKLEINSTGSIAAGAGVHVASMEKGALFVASGSNVTVYVGSTSNTQTVPAPTFLTGGDGMHALAGSGTTKSVNLRAGRFYTTDNSNNNVNWYTNIVTVNGCTDSGASMSLDSKWSSGIGCSDVTGATGTDSTHLCYDSSFYINYKARKYCARSS